MLEQIRAGVRKVDESVGKPYDDMSERISRSLLAACKYSRDKYPYAADSSLSSNPLLRLYHFFIGTTCYVFSFSVRLYDPAHSPAFVSFDFAFLSSFDHS